MATIDDQSQQESQETASDKQAQSNQKNKKGPFAALKKLFSYKLQIVSTEPNPKKGKKSKKSDASGDESLVDPAQEGEGKPVKGKKKADKKAKKKAKVKAPPKPKAKAKAPKDDEGKKGKKKLLIIAIAGVVAVGGGLGAFLLLSGGDSPEKLLAKAHDYTEKGEYVKSLEIYNELIDQEDMEQEVLVQSYLGMADTLVAAEDLDGAISKLQLGYQHTEDILIEEKLIELTPEPEAGEENAAPIDLPVTWKDSAFEKMVRIALGKPVGDIMESELKSVTTLKILGEEHATTQSDGLKSLNYLDSYTIGGQTFTLRGSISSLDDIAHFTNLRRLTVGYNHIDDIGAVAGLENLTLLGLYANDITDISALSGLTGLQYLYLYNNKISDVSPLVGLVNLRELSLQHNEIADLSPLSGLKDLHELYVGNNRIMDLTPLSGLTSLAFLGAQNNNIADITAVSEMTGLTDASFVNNPIQDLSPASHLQSLNKFLGANTLRIS